VFDGIFSKGGARKNRNVAKRIRRGMAGVGEAEEKYKVRTRLELVLNGREAENSIAGSLNSNLELAYLSVIGYS